MNSVGSGAVCLQDELVEQQAQQFGKAQILVAEDDATVAQELKCRLESLDYEVVAITQYAEEAVTLAEKLAPDLVLMDIQLRGEMDGIQAAEKIRKLRLPLIYVSGCCDGPCSSAPNAPNLMVTFSNPTERMTFEYRWR